MESGLWYFELKKLNDIRAIDNGLELIVGWAYRLIKPIIFGVVIFMRENQK